jgi:hypothetical protein
MLHLSASLEKINLMKLSFMFLCSRAGPGAVVAGGKVVVSYSHSCAKYKIVHFLMSMEGMMIIFCNIFGMWKK